MNAKTFKDGICRDMNARNLDTLHKRIMKGFRKHKIESALVISDYGATTELFCSADITVAGKIRVCYIDENGEDRAEEFTSVKAVSDFVGERIKAGAFPAVTTVYNHLGAEDSLSIFALKGGDVQMYEISNASPNGKPQRM